MAPHIDYAYKVIRLGGAGVGELEALFLFFNLGLKIIKK